MKAKRAAPSPPGGTALAVLASALLAGACSGGKPGDAAAAPGAPAWSVREIPSPAPAGSAQPNFATGEDGKVYLSWLETTEGQVRRLRFAVRDGDAWSRPGTVAEGENLLANWADFPSLVPLAGGGLAAHWLVLRPGADHAYDAHVSVSKDGDAWSRPVRLHDDDTASEHGFVSLVPLAAGGAAAFWLDGREIRLLGKGEGHTGSMTLRHATVTAEGTIEGGSILDPQVCECCGTAAVAAGGGAVVFYRDRSEREVRDIYRVRVRPGAEPETGSPSAVHEDGWEIAGCPVNGPAADARGERVVVAWFTSAGDQTQVKAAFSSDGGQTFAPPQTIVGRRALGRTGVVLLDGSSALVSWLEDGQKSGLIVARRISADGPAGEPFVIAETRAARASGFPRLAAARDGVLAAWTEASQPPRVHVALVRAR